MKSTVDKPLPVEVAQIAQNVSVEKRSEVQTVLNHVFNGVTKMREQLEAVEVVDENDKTGMKLANTIRLGVRKVRLDAEKVFDAKRAEVQKLMLSYKTEDQLWLKAKQTMQILTKEIEEQARYKEETKERFEKEQKELRTQQRILLISKFNPDIPSTAFEDMSDENFTIFHAGVKKQYDDRIEAELKAQEEKVAKEKAEAEERERIRIENERLKKEAEKKEKQLAKEREKAEAERKAFQKKVEEEKAAIEAKLEKERLVKEKLEAELKSKAEEEARKKKEEEERIALDLKIKREAERKAKNAPDKIKLTEFLAVLESITYPKLKNTETQEIVEEVKIQITKTSEFIREKLKGI